MSQLVNWVANFPFVQYSMGFFQDFIVRVLKTGPVPNHVAFVMDGNRRFAKFNQLELREGHVAGADSLMHIIEFCRQIGVKAITIYAFSIENFSRPKHEVDTLLNVIRTKIVLLVEGDNSLVKRCGIKLKILGNREMLPPDIQAVTDDVEEQSKDNTDMVLNICFPYTSRDDVTTAIKKIATKVKNKEMTPEQITVETFEKEMATADCPPLDILVRTSGATRLSDFMLWEANMDCKVQFVETLWPDFSVWDLYRICLKWSYDKTKELSELEVLQSIKNLPQAPPVVSVRDVEKSKAIQSGGKVKVN